MTLCYVIDYAFKQTPDGRVWTDTSYDAAFWLPYLEVYSAVTVVARVEAVERHVESWREVEGPRVTVACMPFYSDANQFAMRSSATRAALRTLFTVPTAVILRMPSDLARCACEVLERLGRDYALDLAGDPHERLAPGIVNIQGRALFRQIFTRSQRRMCLRAIGVSYVAQTLANSYPTRAGVLNLVCSDVRLEGHWLRAQPRRHKARKHVNLLTVANLSQTYKGIDILLQAALFCLQRELDFSLTIVGSGRHREELEHSALQLGLAGHVTFAGAIPWGPELIAQFDRADLFVLPSRVEVMPRALLEAMARGLPAIATRVGAVPELLPGCDLVPPGSAYDLAERITEVAFNLAELDAMSKRNLATAGLVTSSPQRKGWQRFHKDLLATFVRRLAVRRAA